MICRMTKGVTVAIFTGLCEEITKMQYPRETIENGKLLTIDFIHSVHGVEDVFFFNPRTLFIPWKLDFTP